MPQACYHYFLRMTEQTSTAARKPAPLPQLDGVLVLNKPSGPTSARCLSALKRLGQRKIGHAGTLDPMASGVLLVLLGQGTKIASHLLADGGKVYSGQLRLGLTTDTWDIQGEVLTESPWQQVTEADVRAEVAHWLTLHEQEVPAYSAAKHEGQSLYKLARKGKEVPKKVKSMEISQADVLEVELPFVRFRVACSSGTDPGVQSPLRSRSGLRTGRTVGRSGPAGEAPAPPCRGAAPLAGAGAGRSRRGPHP